MKNERFSFYKEHPKTCHPDDFWGQVKRTVNGIAVSQDQIDMIVNVVVKNLELGQNDVLLDLCCGNGALSTLLFKYCSGGMGVDFSEYLISIANKNFANDSEEFICQDVVEFCQAPRTSLRYSKAVCYGSFAYLEKESAKQLLVLMKENFPNIKRFFIGNCPDKALIKDFFAERKYTPGIEDEADSAIGIWRTRTEFASLARNCGWEVKFKKMPNNYYASHYRYDVVLNHG